MLAKPIEQYLQEHHVSYTTIPHVPAYTAAETAQAAHIPGKQMAKVVVIKLEDRLVMMVIPAHFRLNLDTLRTITQSDEIELAHEYEFTAKFPGCEIGAMPPFGELFAMDVYLADSLANQDWFAFNCGSHSECIKMKSKDFLELVHPKSLPQC